jgi:hypothetical protein
MPGEPPVMSAIFPSSFLDIIFFLFLNLVLLQIQLRMWAMPFALVDLAQHFRFAGPFLAWTTRDLVAETEMPVNVLLIFILQASPYAFGRSRSLSIHSRI